MSIHLLLAAAAAVAMQGADPLAPLPTQPQTAAPPILVPVNSLPQSAPETVPNVAPSFEVGPAQPVTVVQQPLVVPQRPVVVARVPRNWGEVFSAIRGSRWAEAQAGISSLPRSELTAVARAELYTAKGSPVVSLAQIQGLLAEAPDLPQADQLARMALARGATTTPEYIRRRQTTWLGNSPGRYKAKPISDEPQADQLRSQLDPLIKADDAINA